MPWYRIFWARVSWWLVFVNRFVIRIQGVISNLPSTAFSGTELRFGFSFCVTKGLGGTRLEFCLHSVIVVRRKRVNDCLSGRYYFTYVASTVIYVIYMRSNFICRPLRLLGALGILQLRKMEAPYWKIFQKDVFIILCLVSIF